MFVVASLKVMSRKGYYNIVLCNSHFCFFSLLPSVVLTALSYVSSLFVFVTWLFCLSGLIKLVSKHRAQLIYTRNTKGGDEEAAAEKA